MSPNFPAGSLGWKVNLISAALARSLSLSLAVTNKKGGEEIDVFISVKE